MAVKVLGISGSPVKNSNTDRLVNAILEATGLRIRKRFGRRPPDWGA
jgi:hypothetical protein